MRTPVEFNIGGVTAEEWFDAFEQCSYLSHDLITFELREWPDGGSYIEQDNMVVSVFTIIREEYKKLKSNELRDLQRRQGAK